MEFYTFNKFFFTADGLNLIYFIFIEIKIIFFSKLNSAHLYFSVLLDKMSCFYIQLYLNISWYTILMSLRSKWLVFYILLLYHFTILFIFIVYLLFSGNYYSCWTTFRCRSWIGKLKIRDNTSLLLMNQSVWNWLT